jgi:hypothetical protein
MTSFLNIPFLNPIKFVPNTATPGKGFDDDWMYEQIKSFETKVNYYQKWQIGDSTPVQVESTILPSDLEIHDCTGLKKSIPFVKTADGADLGTNIYEAVVSLDDLPVNKIYYAYIKATYGDVTFEAISEPIRLQTLWPGTLNFAYKNSVNNWGVAFTTGIEFNFRCEAGIMDFNPDADDSDYIDQIHNVEQLAGTPFRTFKLYIGDEKGVAPWVLDLLNRIFLCDHVEIEGMGYTKNSGAKWEINRVKPWPLYGGSLEIIPSINASGLQFMTDEDITAGLVVAYDIDTNFFGHAEDEAHIIDIENLD